VTELLEQRLRERKLATVGAALEQPTDDRGVTRGVGDPRGPFHTAREPLGWSELGDILEERPETAPGRAHVVQTPFGRLADKTPARAFQRSELAPDGLYQPLHYSGALIDCGFDGGVSADLREEKIPT